MTHLRTDLSTAQARILLAGALLGSASCGNGSERATSSPPHQDTVEIAAGKVELGFALGALRSESSTADFRISRFPTTRREYASCVEADACREASCTNDVDAEANEGAAMRPMDCADADRAAAFCRWIGGRLPRLDEWLKAARGERVQRFPWGDTLPTCDQHPWAGASLAARSGVSDAAFGKGAPRCVISRAQLAVGMHSEGASAAGLEDVLLTPGEIATPLAESPAAACSDQGTGACVVYGRQSGAIDGVTDVAPSASHTGLGFRCVWGK